MLNHMDKYLCTPASQPLDTVVSLPGSKSITNRALIVAALADGTSVLSGALLAEDTRLMIDALKTLGIAVTVDEPGNTVEVTGCRGHLPASEGRLFCGNAGTVMRFCTALVATGFGLFELDGAERMRQRPIAKLVEVLQVLGAGVEYMGKEEYPPLRVRAGHLRGGHISFASLESSQFVSALMLVAPSARGDVLIEASGNMPSTPYLKMTTAVMDKFGVSVVEQYRPDNIRLIVPAPQHYAATCFTIEPDASGSTYFLAAPAIAGGKVTVKGVGTCSIQGDARFVTVLERMGCRIERAADALTVVGPAANKPLSGIDIDLNDMPDTVPTVAALALFAAGPTTVRNVANLRLKESNRIDDLGDELCKLGARVDRRPDGLTIHPPDQLRPAALDTHNDHRLAMSFALIGLRQSGVVINDPTCCAKTFPDFFRRWEHMCAPGPTMP